MKTLRTFLASALLVTLAPALSLAGISINGGSATVEMSSTEQSGSFEIYVESDLGVPPDLADWQLVLDSQDSRIVLSSGETTVDRPYFLDGVGILFNTRISNGGARIKAVDSGLESTAPLDDGDGLLRVNFTVAPNTPVGNYELSFSEVFISDLSGEDVVLSGVQSAMITVVPEPGTMVLSILGILGVVAIAARRRSA